MARSSWPARATNRELGAWAADDAKADAIERACREMTEGLLDEHIVVDAPAGRGRHLAPT